MSLTRAINLLRQVQTELSNVMVPPFTGWQDDLLAVTGAVDNALANAERLTDDLKECHPIDVGHVNAA